MKLHLPKMLTVALLAAFATFTQAQAAAPQTIGQTLTWDAGNADASAGKYVMTTFDQDGNVTYGQTYQGWNQAGMQQFFYNQMGNRNTLRFSSDKGSGQKSIKYTFNWFTIGGILVDTGATGFDIHCDGGNDRSFYLGTTVNGTTAYSTIKADFTLNQASTNPKSLIHLQGNQVFDVENGNTFHLKQSNNYALDFDTQLTVQGGGTVAFDGTSAVAMTGNASLTVMADSTVTFSKDVTGLATTINNNGTINFNGTVSLADSLSGFEVSGTYVDYQGHNADNGYAGDLDYTIIKGNTDALTTVTWKGVTQTLNQGVMHVAGEVDYTNYHLITTGASLDLAEELGHNALLSKVTMAAGTTLNYNTNNYSGTIETAATSTVSIAAGVTLSTPLTAGIIAGQGTYALASGASSMGAVTRGAGWTGTVKLTDVSSMTNIDLNAYGQQGSKVEMDGITGYFTSVSTEFLPGLVLSGSGLVLNNGYSTSAGAPTAYTFAGGVSGEGSMTFNKTSQGTVTQNLYFTGDVSQWSGSLSVVAGFTVTAHYSGEALTVGSTISRTGGTLHVDVQAGSNVTFNGAITNASSLTVQEGATATLKAASSIGTLTSTGALTVNAGEGTVSFTGASHTIGKTITLAAGTLSLAGAYNLDGLVSEDFGYEYIGGGDIAEGNGFGKAKGTVQVADIQPDAVLNVNDATFSYRNSAVTVEEATGTGSIVSTVDYTTFYVNRGTDKFSAAWEVAQGLPEPQEVTSVVLANGTAIDMDKEGGVSTALALDGDGTVVATVDTTITALTGTGTLIVSGDETTVAVQAFNDYEGTYSVDTGATLQFATNNLPATLTVEGAGMLRLLTNQGGQNSNLKEITASNLRLAADNNHNSRFVVNSSTDLSGVDHLYFDGGQLWLDQAGLDFAGDVTFLTTTYTENNAFNLAAMRIHHDGTFSGDVDVQDTAKLVWGVSDKTIDFSGSLSGSGNIELGNFQGATGTLLISGNASRYNGAITSIASIALNVAEGAELSIGGGSNIAGAVTLANEGQLTVNGADDSVISGVISGAGSLVKDGTGKLTLSGDNTDHTGTTVVKGGELVVTGAIDSTKITVEGDAVISGSSIDTTQVGIATGATAEFTKDVTTDEVLISCEAEGTVKVSNSGDAATYSIDNEDMHLEASSLLMLADDHDVVIANKNVDVDSVVNMTGQALTLSNTESLELTYAMIGEGSTLALSYTDEGQVVQEGTVTITDTLMAGGANLLADLTLTGETVELNLITDDGYAALTLGSKFTVTEGTLVTLDAVTLAAIAALENIDDKVVLLRAYEDEDGMRELTSNLQSGDWARPYFDLSSITNADYKLFLDGSEFSIRKASNVPEPTTGTLSLLALAALAARRRRK